MKQKLRLPRTVSFKDPKVRIRAAVGALLAANVIAAAFAFHLFGQSPATLSTELDNAGIRLRAAQLKLNRSRTLTTNIGKGKDEGDKFLASYLTNRRTTYSTIIGEVTQLEKDAGIKPGDSTIAPLDPIEGSDDLDMMTISAQFEGNYAQLVKLVNLLDRSPRFLIIEGLQVNPQTGGANLMVTVKFNAFIKEEHKRTALGGVQ